MQRARGHGYATESHGQICEERMYLGIFSYNTDYGARPDELARACENRGFESLWVGEHTHIPALRRTPYPGGDPLPRPYYHMADPFVSLMAAAAVITRLKIGTGVCLVVEHDPIGLAKTVATLDLLSNGRFLFGIGGGWNAEEMENHGTPFARRWQCCANGSRLWRRSRLRKRHLTTASSSASTASSPIQSRCRSHILPSCLVGPPHRAINALSTTAMAGYPSTSCWMIYRRPSPICDTAPKLRDATRQPSPSQCLRSRHPLQTRSSAARTWAWSAW